MYGLEQTSLYEMGDCHLCKEKRTPNAGFHIGIEERLIGGPNWF
jgi:hypothetical protein